MVYVQETVSRSVTHLACTDSGMYNKATIQYGIDHAITQDLAHKLVVWPGESQGLTGVWQIQ